MARNQSEKHGHDEIIAYGRAIRKRLSTGVKNRDLERSRWAAIPMDARGTLVNLVSKCMGAPGIAMTTEEVLAHYVNAIVEHYGA